MKKISLLMLFVFMISIFASSAFAVPSLTNTDNTRNAQIDSDNKAKLNELSTELENISPLNLQRVVDSTQSRIKDVNIVKEKFKNLIRQRTISTDKLNQIRNDYKKAVENYNTLNKDLNQQKLQIQNAIKAEKECTSNCGDLEQETIDAVKEHLYTMTGVMKETVNRVQNRIMENEGFSQEAADTMIALNEEKLNSLNDFESRINSIQTKEEVKALWKEILTYWNQNKNKFKEQLNNISSTQVNSILVRMNVLENKLSDLENQLDSSLVTEFSSLINEARAFYDAELYFEANKKLREANLFLMQEIMPALRENLSSEEVENVLKIDDNEEIEIIQVEYEEEPVEVTSSNTSEVEMRSINPTLQKKIVLAPQIK